MTAPSSLSHPAKGLSTLPTPRGAAVSRNKSLKYAGLALCVQELKLGCCSAVYLCLRDLEIALMLPKVDCT